MHNNMTNIILRTLINLIIYWGFLIVALLLWRPNNIPALYSKRDVYSARIIWSKLINQMNKQTLNEIRKK